MKTKKCYKCKENLSLNCFKKHCNRSDGLQPDCIKCQKEYRKQHYLRNKNIYVARAKIRNKLIKEEVVKWLREYKSNCCCVRCGESHVACLQFHHINDDKEFGIAQASSRRIGLKRLKKEIEKCIVLCANCHFKYHWDNG